MFLAFHGAYPPEHTVLCVCDKVHCQNPLACHCSSTLSVRKCMYEMSFKSTATFDCAGQRQLMSRADLAVRQTHPVLIGFERYELCSMRSVLHVP